MTASSDDQLPWTPARYLSSHAFGKRPLVIGEAPSPVDPENAWVAGAKSTDNLIALIYGSTGTHDDLTRDFELSNVFDLHPGKSASGFSKFDRTSAASVLQQLSQASQFDDRVTFFMGRRVSQALASTSSFEPAIDRKSNLKFKPARGWIDWVPVGGGSNSLGLFVMVPHPQSYSRYAGSNLIGLSALFRLALGRSPLDALGNFRKR
jgi:hypothetical protein